MKKLGLILISLLLVKSAYSVQLSKDPWNTIKVYGQCLKAHDINGLMQVDYMSSHYSQCQESAKQEQCFKMMDFLAKNVEGLVEKDYVNVWQDARQLILRTNPKPIASPTTKGYSYGQIMFIKEKNGNLKLLRINPDRTSTQTTDPKATNSSAAEIDSDLQKMILDSDQDGLSDREETCPFKTGCTPTDPNKRDTDGDGWWDGIQKAMQK